MKVWSPNGARKASGRGYYELAIVILNSIFSNTATTNSIFKFSSPPGLLRPHARHSIEKSLFMVGNPKLSSELIILSIQKN